MCEKSTKEWAGGGNWMRARGRKSTLEEKYKFVTFVLDRMKLSPEHRKNKNREIEKIKNREIEKNIKVKILRDLRPEDTTVRSEGATVQECYDNNVARKRIHGAFLRSTEERSEKFKRPITHGGQRMSPSRFRTLTAS